MLQNIGFGNNFLDRTKSTRNKRKNNGILLFNFFPTPYAVMSYWMQSAWWKYVNVINNYLFLSLENWLLNRHQLITEYMDFLIISLVNSERTKRWLNSALPWQKQHNETEFCFLHFDDSTCTIKEGLLLISTLFQHFVEIYYLLQQSFCNKNDKIQN